jgi:pyruvate/2-oxoglutarate dehydrogenase complex dihydrolipoamide dehydrogenase (E3) component
MGIEETDIVVIGMGSGGETAAGRLAEAGLHVTGIEARLVGGECPYWGCVPSKMMIRAADLLGEGRRAPYPTFHRAIEDALQDLASK